MSEFLLLMKHEMMITLIIFVLLFLKLGSREWRNSSLINLMNVLLTVNFIAGFFLNQTGSLFGDMFFNNELLALEKSILNLGTLLISLQSWHWLKEHKHVAEFYVLMLSTLLGMQFMLSSGNLLMFYLGLELSTIPLAALANFDLEKRRSSEAALKMIMSSAFASGLLLFGISLLYGTTGTISLAEIPTLLNGTPLQLFALILLISGFGFKISAVPFHLWTADVYEGAPVAVTSYLSVISKGAVLFVMSTVLTRYFMPLSIDWCNILVVLSVATLIVGNLFALRQQNMKRFLAFSSIAQVGFILIGMTGQTAIASASVIYFILVYVFSNLAAFGVVSLVSAVSGKENMDDYRGFSRTNPALAWILAIAMFSLAGIPPTAGFFGKYFLLIAGASQDNYILITIAALNMVIALYYYLKVIMAMFIHPSDTPVDRIAIGVQPKMALIICVAGIVITGLASGVYQYIFSLVG